MMQKLGHFDKLMEVLEHGVLNVKESICSKPLRGKAMAYKEHCYQRLGDFMRRHLGPKVVLPEPEQEAETASSKKRKHM